MLNYTLTTLVAAMVADMEVDKVADMVADMEVDKVVYIEVNKVADMEVDKVAYMVADMVFVVRRCGRHSG